MKRRAGSGTLTERAHLGNYYAEKILAADGENADDHLKAAAARWHRYASVASGQYTPQLLGRAGWGDWKEAYGNVLKDISIEGGHGDPPSLSATPGGTLFEAEQARAQSAAYQSSVSWYTGNGYMSVNGAGSSVAFTVEVPEAGEYLLEFRYILEDGEGNMSLSINGEDQSSINFWRTGGSKSWAWDRKPAMLKKGTNKVVIGSTGLSPKLDHLNVIPCGSGKSH